MTFEVDEQEVNSVNNEQMASYSQTVSGNNGQGNTIDIDDTDELNNQYQKQSYTQFHYRANETVNPILLRHEDVFGSRKLERTSWLTNVEIYKTIGDTVQEST